MQNGFTSGAVAALLVLLGASTAGAQDFYKGKELTIYTGSASGGPYDAYARLIARHLVRNIPGNPSVIVQSMPGASGRRMMGYMQNLAPKDGTVIAAPQRAVPFDPLTESDSHFDARKFGWLGSANNETNICMVWHTSALRTFTDLYSKEMVVGTSGPSSTDAIYPNVINSLFGTKFKVVTGYKGAAETNIAMERGEVDGRCGISWDTLVSLNEEWLRDKKIRLLVQFALDKNPELLEVPSVFDFAKTDEQRQILTFWATPNKMGRPFAMAPGTPPDRVALMRRAFEATMKDPQLIGEAAKMKLAVDSIGGEEIRQANRPNLFVAEGNDRQGCAGEQGTLRHHHRRTSAVLENLRPFVLRGCLDSCARLLEHFDAAAVEVRGVLGSTRRGTGSLVT